MEKMIATTKISKKDGEFRVRCFINGEYQPGGDYFTDDKEDAEQTAKAWRDNPTPTDSTTSFAKEELAEYKEELYKEEDL